MLKENIVNPLGIFGLRQIFGVYYVGCVRIFLDDNKEEVMSWGSDIYVCLNALLYGVLLDIYDDALNV